MHELEPQDLEPEVDNVPAETEEADSPAPDDAELIDASIAGETEVDIVGKAETAETSDEAPALDDDEDTTGDEDTDEEEPDDGRSWYVVHTYSGYEHKVMKNLEHRIESMNMQDQIFQVIVPTEDEIEMRDGKRRTTAKRIFPGYVFVQMLMNDESWYVVRNTPGVTGFVGVGTKPSPLPPEEVDKVMQRIESEEPKVKVSFKVGQKVRITDGIFAEFMGIVDNIYPEKGKARVLVSFFNRETPVEVDFLQLERA